MVEAGTRDSAPDQFPIVVYLNERYVFDLVAMNEGGLTQFEEVRTRREQEKAAEKSGGGEASASPWGIFSLRLTATRSKKDRTTQGEDVSATRLFTPNSLFARLRDALMAKDLVITDPTKARPGDFVEISARLRRNPVIGNFQAMASFVKLASSFAPPPGKKSGQPDSKKTAEQIERLVGDLSAGPTLEVIGAIAEKDMRLVLTLEKEYLLDPGLNDLLDGEYRILGKVTKTIPGGSPEKINLLRRTSLAPMASTLLSGFNTEELRQSGFRLDDNETELSGPLLQMVPLAIFA